VAIFGESRTRSLFNELASAKPLEWGRSDRKVGWDGGGGVLSSTLMFGCSPTERKSRCLVLIVARSVETKLTNSFVRGTDCFVDI